MGTLSNFSRCGTPRLKSLTSMEAMVDDSPECTQNRPPSWTRHLPPSWTCRTRRSRRTSRPSMTRRKRSPSYLPAYSPFLCHKMHGGFLLPLIVLRKLIQDRILLQVGQRASGLDMHRAFAFSTHGQKANAPPGDRIWRIDLALSIRSSAPAPPVGVRTGLMERGCSLAPLLFFTTKAPSHKENKILGVFVPWWFNCFRGARHPASQRVSSGWHPRRSGKPH